MSDDILGMMLERVKNVALLNAFKIGSMVGVIAQKMLFDKGFAEEYVNELNKYDLLKISKDELVKSTNEVYEKTIKELIRINNS